MARPRTRIPLDVYLNGRLVGKLRRQASGSIDFQYDEAWLATEQAIPVSLSLPLREDRYIGDRVISVFDNLLPDNGDIRRRLAERVHADGTDVYSLLGAIGRDCVGALQFLPEGTSAQPPDTMKGERLTEGDVATLLGDLKRSPLGIHGDQDFRISLAGAQEKTALLYWKNAWHLPHGTTPTTHILKPQIGRLPNGIDLSQSVENEHLCLRIVSAFGLPVAPSRIMDFGGRRVLVSERFDRQWTKAKRLRRIPQEDCCQALGAPLSRKYEQDGGPGIRAIVALLKGSNTPDIDLRRFMKAQILYWLLAATDGHAKNFSIKLEEGGRFILAPLYDVVSTQPVYDANQISKKHWKFSMAVGENRHYAEQAILPRHFLQTARLCNLPEELIRSIFDELIAAERTSIDKALSEMPKKFPQKLATSIVAGLRKRMLAIKESATR